MGVQAGAEQSTFEVPHQNMLHKSSSKPRLNDAVLAFKSNFILLTIEYSHAQNQLNKCTSYNFMHGDIFNYNPPHAHHKGNSLSFFFSVLRDEELKSDREDPLMVKAGSLSCLAICLSSTIYLHFGDRNLSCLKRFCCTVYTKVIYLLKR